jgi:hypothetical protein
MEEKCILARRVVEGPQPETLETEAKNWRDPHDNMSIYANKTIMQPKNPLPR